MYAELKWRMAPYGTHSPFVAYNAARAMRLDDATVAQITCPVLLTDPDDEQFWPGQSRTLFDELPGEKAILRFTRDEGANFHCEPAGLALRDERVFDWLEDVLARERSDRETSDGVDSRVPRGRDHARVHRRAGDHVVVEAPGMRGPIRS